MGLIGFIRIAEEAGKGDMIIRPTIKSQDLK
jgi:hypothetical protein